MIFLLMSAYSEFGNSVVFNQVMAWNALHYFFLDSHFSKNTNIDCQNMNKSLPPTMMGLLQVNFFPKCYDEIL